MLELLKKIVGQDNIKTNEPMASHTTFRAGGIASVFVEPQNDIQLSQVIKVFKQAGMPYYILGNGSNVLVRDSGYNGGIIKIDKGFNNIIVEKTGKETTIIEAGAGAMLSKVAKLAADYSLTGMETLSGIPGTVGGAVVMNAGAYGSEVKDIIIEAKVMDGMGEIINLSKDELELSYRNSVIQREEYVVLQATFALNYGDMHEILNKMAECAQARKTKQPLEYPSAGSTFKRPEGNYAGKLIMDSGLAGYRVGGAQVSEKHCGFVINTGNATATDILEVMEHIKVTVKEKFNVELEPEVRILG